MRAVAGTLVILALAAPLARSGGAGTDTAAPPATATLYQRLGGYDSLAVLTDDFIARLARDPSLSRFFAPLGAEAKGRFRQLLLDQLCAASGGPCLYVGRDMKAAHQGLGIGEAHWAATVGHLIASLDKRAVGPKEKDEVLQMIARLKKDIVERP